mmetsp:Transcript_8459/g.31310  ORF Transcript_8459/g.31310 Transcript_8459/m.31310 type:complete len:251 (+) Transcript_8459:1288-2040(+)
MPPVSKFSVKSFAISMLSCTVSLLLLLSSLLPLAHLCVCIVVSVLEELVNLLLKVMILSFGLLSVGLSLVQCFGLFENVTHDGSERVFSLLRLFSVVLVSFLPPLVGEGSTFELSLLLLLLLQCLLSLLVRRCLLWLCLLLLLNLVFLSILVILCSLLSCGLILLKFVGNLDDFVHHSLAERLLLASRLFFLLKSFLFCIIELLIEFCTSFKELRSNLLPKFTSVQLLFLPLLILGWRFWFLHLLRSLLS